MAIETVRNGLIIVFGAIPATVAFVFGFVVIFLYRYGVFGSGPLWAIGGIVWLALALWGTAALWFSLSRSAPLTNSLGLIAGLVASIPAIYFVINEPAGMIRFGWISLPAIVAIILLAARTHRSLRSV